MNTSSPAKTARTRPYNDRAVYTAQTAAYTVSYTAPCTGPCTRHVHGRRRPCRRPVHSHVHGWYRRAVCTAHTRPCTGRVYSRAVIQPCMGGFRGRRRVHGPCTRPPCNWHTTRYTAVYALCRRPKTAVYTASVHGRKRPCTWPIHCRIHEPIRPVHGRIHDTLHDRVRPYV